MEFPGRDIGGILVDAPAHEAAAFRRGDPRHQHDGSDRLLRVRVSTWLSGQIRSYLPCSGRASRESERVEDHGGGFEDGFAEAHRSPFAAWDTPGRHLRPRHPYTKAHGFLGTLAFDPTTNPTQLQRGALARPHIPGRG